MIHFQFLSDSDRRLTTFFEQSTPRILAAVEKAITLAMADLQAYIQRDKLQGQVLKSHKNGAGLAGSLNIRIERDGDISIAGYVGTAIIYARIHEYGFNGMETVRSFTRMQTMAWGKPMKSPREVVVQEHQRFMFMPARPYMRPSLQEKKQAIVDRVREAISEALRTA